MTLLDCLFSWGAVSLGLVAAYFGIAIMWQGFKEVIGYAYSKSSDGETSLQRQCGLRARIDNLQDSYVDQHSRITALREKLSADEIRMVDRLVALSTRMAELEKQAEKHGKKGR